MFLKIRSFKWQLVKRYLEAVGAMSVMDLNDLVKAFEEKFGVSAAAMAVAGPAAGGAAAAAEEQTEFINSG